MIRKITMAAVATAGLVVLGACSRGDNDYDDTAAGMTAGAMATPPATFPAAGATTGVVADSGDSAKWTNADSARHKTKLP